MQQYLPTRFSVSIWEWKSAPTPPAKSYLQAELPGLEEYRKHEKVPGNIKTGSKAQAEQNKISLFYRF